MVSNIEMVRKFTHTLPPYHFANKEAPPLLTHIIHQTYFFLFSPPPLPLHTHTLLKLPYQSLPSYPLSFHTLSPLSLSLSLWLNRIKQRKKTALVISSQNTVQNSKIPPLYFQRWNNTCNLFSSFDTNVTCLDKPLDGIFVELKIVWLGMEISPQKWPLVSPTFLPLQHH